MIDAQKVPELLDYPGLVEAIRQAHLGEMPKMSDRHIDYFVARYLMQQLR